MSAPRQFVNGHWVYGAPAQEHIIKKNGGWDKFIAKISRESADEAVNNVISKLQKEFSKPNIKRVK
jgi:hypothetical protein